ncbi:hypothetical protein P4O66_005878 [Electrophorus voltai]|uniref:Uncharacterized protein n=1 Tax=Electrophorus voltai TaxID=2609070 RepID=A0AAD8ZJP5_9TELE|nr:hypothetical protein P4O66_005878 [Electrophorus voltai]
MNLFLFQTRNMKAYFQKPARNEMACLQTQVQMTYKVIEIYQSGKGYKVISKALGFWQTTERAIIHKWQKQNSGEPSQE